MALKVKKSSASRARTRLLGIFIATLVIIVVCVITLYSSRENRKTVSVVRLKAPISANALITEDMVEEYKMYYKEYEQYGTVTFQDGKKRQVVVAWKDKDAILGKRYAAYYMRKDTVLFWDATVKEQPKKNSYLYSMEGELLNIKMDTTDFGDMVVPGDTLNIRVSYNKVNYDLPTEEQYKLAEKQGISTEPVSTPVTEMLFSEVTVLDMLNNKGNSIFDIYFDYISKSKTEQEQLLKNSEFLKSVKPDTILLEVTAEEADRFMDISSKNPRYLMTLLPRDGSNAMIDSLSDIQTALSNQSK